MPAQQTIYEQLGGADGIRSIVETFYPIVQNNAQIGPLFPEDIVPVKEKQYLFLTQFFGGPPLYSNEYGHPMMRARHADIYIDEQNARAWLACMDEALSRIGIEQPLKQIVLHRLSGPAFHFVNH